MAREGTEQLVFSVEARITQLEKEMKRAGQVADRSLGGMERRARRTARSMESDMVRSTARINQALAATSTRIGAFSSSFGGMLGLGGLGAGGLALGGLLASVQSVSSELAKVGDTADKIGIATEELQRLRIAAEKTGGSAEALDRGMATFARNISQAASGSGELKSVLEANGVALRDSEGRLRSTNDLLKDFANLVRGARSPADQLRLATMAFGTAGTELVGMLRGGADEIGRLGDEAVKAGHVIEDRLIRKAQEIDDKFQTIARTVGTALKGAVIEVVSKVQEFFDLLQRLDAAAVGRAAGQTIEDERRKKVIADLITLEKRLAEQKDINARYDTAHTALAVANTERRIEALRRELAVLDRSRQEIDGMMDTLHPGEQPGDGKPTTIPSTAAKTSGDSKNQYERAQERLRQRIEMLRVETKMLGKNTEATETARARVELLNAAKAASIPETETLTKAVDALAAKWGKAAAEAKNAKDEFQALQDAAKEFGDIATSALQGLIVEGKSFNDVLADMAKRLANRAIQQAMEALLFGGGAKGGGGGGLFGKLLGFDGGGYTGPGGKYEPAGVVHRGEFVWSQQDVRRAGGPAAVEAMRQGLPGYAAGGYAGLPTGGCVARGKGFDR